ncbi:MAG: hypothetical protein ACI89L_000612 [Phycisphaerales bacterium]|jgi:hypothetical protein
MAGKQAMPTQAFDPKLFAKRVQKVRNSQKKDFYDWIDRECKSIEKGLAPFAKGKVKKEKAVAEIGKLVKLEKKELDKLEKASKDKANYAEGIKSLEAELPDDLDPKLRLVLTKLVQTGSELAEQERKDRENQLAQTLQLIARNKGAMAKVYGSDVADPITVLSIAVALLIQYVSGKKK